MGVMILILSLDTDYLSLMQSDLDLLGSLETHRYQPLVEVVPHSLKTET